MIGSICDASHADEHCERTGEPYRSQGGRMTILATRSLVDQAECGFHLIACTSNAEAGLPFYSHSRDIPDGIGCRSRRSAASRDYGHV